jgi:excisionase family DNA binding protein
MTATRAPRCPVLGCECQCHRARVRQVPRLWTPGMDRALTEALDRGDHPGSIAAGMHLTIDSIKWRAKHLDRSLREGWRSRQEVAAVLGVGRRAVDRWMRDGSLLVQRHGTRWTRVRDADLEAFVSAQAGVAFDPSGVSDPRLRRLAETSALANRRHREAV